VTPVLAGILAFADVNRNLDIVGHAFKHNVQWLYTLWLDMMADSDVTALRYRLYI
jgi:hypothetical protein